MKIDWWTLGFQTVNVAVLIWLLGHFFWKPVAAMIEGRRASAQKLTDDAKATGAKATAALADVETTRAGFATEREAILAEAHKAADASCATILAKAKTEAEALQTAAKAAIAKDKAMQKDAWGKGSSDLAIDIAGRLSARLDGKAVQSCFLEWLVAEIHKLPEATRNAATSDGMKLALVSAVTLDVAEQTSCEQAVAEALGGNPAIGFETDAGLIGGYELRGAHLIIQSSWRADLATIRADLTRERAE